MSQNQEQDANLIKKYLKGDQSCLEVLIQKYLNLVYFIVFSYLKNQDEAQEISQKTFIKVWQNLKKFDKNKNFKSWICSIAKNTSIDYLRERKTIPFSNFKNNKGENIAENLFFDNYPLITEILDQKEITKKLLFIFNGLSKKYKDILILYYYNNLNFREISQIIKKPINTVKSQHRRALIYLRKFI